MYLFGKFLIDLLVGRDYWHQLVGGTSRLKLTIDTNFIVEPPPVSILHILRKFNSAWKYTEPVVSGT